MGKKPVGGLIHLQCQPETQKPMGTHAHSLKRLCDFAIVLRCVHPIQSLYCLRLFLYKQTRVFDVYGGFSFQLMNVVMHRVMQLVYYYACCGCRLAVNQWWTYRGGEEAEEQ